MEQANEEQKYVSKILEELQKWQYVGPASHSFVRRKTRVEQANVKGKHTMEIGREIERLAVDITGMAKKRHRPRDELDALCTRYAQMAKYAELSWQHKETLEHIFDFLAEVYEDSLSQCDREMYRRLRNTGRSSLRFIGQTNQTFFVYR